MFQLMQRLWKDMSFTNKAVIGNAKKNLEINSWPLRIGHDFWCAAACHICVALIIFFFYSKILRQKGLWVVCRSWKHDRKIFHHHYVLGSLLKLARVIALHQHISMTPLEWHYEFKQRIRRCIMGLLASQWLTLWTLTPLSITCTSDIAVDKRE